MKRAKTKLIEILKAEGITNPKVLSSMARLNREDFIDQFYQNEAYENIPLPIDCDQTISQPYIIGRMTQALCSKEPMNKVLEIGTGSGYQAAVLSFLVNEVYTIERHQLLYEKAKARLKKLGLKNIFCRHDDGQFGWPEQAPFDGILVTAAIDEPPFALLQQLREDGGRMIIPIGDEFTQWLQIIDRNKDKYTVTTLDPVRFVPILSGKSTG